MATLRLCSETGDVLVIEGKSGRGSWGILISIILGLILLALLAFLLALVARPFTDQHIEDIVDYIFSVFRIVFIELWIILAICGIIYRVLPKITTITLDKRRGEIEIKRKMIVTRTRYIPLSSSELIGVCFLKIDVEEMGRSVGKIRRILSELLRPIWQTREKGVKGRDLAILRKVRDRHEAVCIYKVVGYISSEVREAARKMAEFLETKFIETPVISATQAYSFFTGARSSREHKVEDFSRQ